MKNKIGVLFLAAILATSACGQKGESVVNKPLTSQQEIMNDNDLQVATLGAGCFWCVEAVFQELIGVHKVVSGYAGGASPNPTYKDISSGNTGHAEVVQVHFDPSKVDFETILEVFWYTHDPTTLNRQGADRGTQYRSVIFYHSDEQRRVAENSKTNVAPTLWDDPIVTEISPYTAFYVAELYHQDYYANNQNAPYCRAVINPKMEKFRKRFEDKLKPDR